MAGKYDESGKYQKGIEDYVLNAQYQTPEHVNAVIGDMLRIGSGLAKAKISCHFATSSIPEAVNYYRLIKARNSGLKLTALFDPNISNEEQDDSDKKNGLPKFWPITTPSSARVSAMPLTPNLKRICQTGCRISMRISESSPMSSWIY